MSHPQPDSARDLVNETPALAAAPMTDSEGGSTDAAAPQEDKHASATGSTPDWARWGETPSGPYAPSPYGPRTLASPAALTSGSPGFAITALVLGVLAAATFAIPTVNLITGAGALVGIVLGLKAILGRRPGRAAAIAGVVVAFLALGSIIAAVGVAMTAARDAEVAREYALVLMKQDAMTYAGAAEARYNAIHEYPAGTYIEAGTVSRYFPGASPSANSIYFRNDGDSFVITVMNPEDAPGRDIVYDSEQGFVD